MYHRAFTRWLYRGQRPNGIARFMNRTWAAVSASGVAAKFGAVTLDVVGRTSGRTVSLPLVMVTIAGERYLVSMLGNDVQWVKNVRAAGGRAALRSGGREEVLLEEIPTDQRAPILKTYLRHAPGARPHIPVDKKAPLADFERIASAYPVFHVAAPEQYGKETKRCAPVVSASLSSP
jgi:hypothetical protein